MSLENPAGKRMFVIHLGKATTKSTFSHERMKYRGNVQTLRAGQGTEASYWVNLTVRILGAWQTRSSVIDVPSFNWEQKKKNSFLSPTKRCHSHDSSRYPGLPDAPFTFLKLFYKCLQCCVICNWMSGKSEGAGTGVGRKVSATGEKNEGESWSTGCEMDSCWVTERWEVFTDNIHLKLIQWKSRITCTNKWTEIPRNEFRFSFRSFSQIKLN